MTKQGRLAVVVVSAADFERLRGPRHRQPLSQFLRASPLAGAGMVVERAPDGMRDVEL